MVSRGVQFPQLMAGFMNMAPRWLKHRFRGLYPSKEVRRVAVGNYTPCRAPTRAPRVLPI